MYVILCSLRPKSKKNEKCKYICFLRNQFFVWANILASCEFILFAHFPRKGQIKLAFPLSAVIKARFVRWSVVFWRFGCDQRRVGRVQVGGDIAQRGHSGGWGATPETSRWYLWEASGPRAQTGFPHPQMKTSSLNRQHATHPPLPQPPPCCLPAREAHDDQNATNFDSFK